MKSVLSILFMALLASCYTQQKAVDQMDKAHSRYEVIAAGKCANWYPVKIDTVQGETRYLPGKPIITPGETKYVDCDSIKNNPGTTNTSKVPVDCPPSMNRVDTFEKNIYIMKENTAKVKQLTLQLQDANKSSQTMKGVIGVLAALFILSVIANIIQFKSKKNESSNQ